MSKSWFEVKAAAGKKSAEALIYDEIGMWGVTAADFDKAIKALGKVDDLALHINSPGGDVFAGNAMVNILDRMKAGGTKITVYVDGIAASMASLIAMVGDKILMPENAMMMIHNPAAGFVSGEAEDLRAYAQVLDSVKASMLKRYSTKSKLSESEVSAIMDAETWMTAEDAVARGFADEVTSEIRIAANFEDHKFNNRPEIRAMKESDMDKEEVEKMIAAGNAPILEALKALTPKVDTKVETPAPKAGAKTDEEVIAAYEEYREEVVALGEGFGIASDNADLVALIKAKTPLAGIGAKLKAIQAKLPKPKGNVRAASTLINNHQVDGEGGDDDHADLVTEPNTRSIYSRFNAVKVDPNRRPARRAA